MLPWAEDFVFLFQSHRSAVASGLLAVFEVFVIRAFLGDANFLNFILSKQFVILLVGGCALFAVHRCSRRAPTPSDAFATAARHRGTIRSFSGTEGSGIIACVDEEEWPGSDNIRFYLADKERLDLHTDDVIDFNKVLEEDGRYRAVNIRYSNDDESRKCLSNSSINQGQVESKDAGLVERRPGTEIKTERDCIDSGGHSNIGALDARTSLAPESGAATSSSNHLQKQTTHPVSMTGQHQRLISHLDEDQLDMVHNIAEDVPSTRLGSIGESSDRNILRRRPRSASATAGYPPESIYTDCVGPRTQEVNVGSDREKKARVFPKKPFNRAPGANMHHSEPVVVTEKNTFLHIEDAATNSVPLKRSASDSDISSSSLLSSSTTESSSDKQNGIGKARCMYWLPGSEGHSNVDEAAQVPLPVQADIEPVAARDHIVWLQPAAEHPDEPMYVATDPYIEQGTGSSSSQPSQQQGTRSTEGIVGADSRHIQDRRFIASSFVSAGQIEMKLVNLLHAETGTPINELEKLHSQGILQKIPRNDEGEFTTVGSILHRAGTCRACVFWFRDSCTKGVHCTFCHFNHEGQKPKRIRPSKATRLKLRAEASEHAAAQLQKEDSPESESELFFEPVKFIL